MIILFICAAFISGCGRKADVTNGLAVQTQAETQAAAMYSGEVPAVYANGSAKMASMNDGIAYEYDAAEEMAAPEMTAAGSTEEYGKVPDPAEERKLIRNVSVSLETEKYEAVTATIKEKIAAFGGYTENYSEYRGSYNYASNRSADITARIPAQNVDAFLSQSFVDAYVTSYNENTQDITLQYTDLETRKASLEIERDRLLSLMEKADDIESIIALEERLTQVRYELESITGSLKHYDNQVTYSTVWISVIEVKKVEAPVEAGFFERISSGFVSGAADFTEGLGNFAVWFVSHIFPVLLFAAIVFAVIKLIGKLSGKKKSAKPQKQFGTVMQQKPDKEEEPKE